MYAYGILKIKSENVWSVPTAAIEELGNESCCFVLVGDKSVKTPVQPGMSDGKWTEVANKRVDGNWQPMDGTEKVILGDLSQLVDGGRVDLATEPAKRDREGTGEGGC